LSKGKVVPVISHEPRHEDEWANERIFDLDTRWRWVVSFMPQSLHSRYPFDRLGGPQPVWTRWRRERNSSLFLPGTEPRSFIP